MHSTPRFCTDEEGQCLDTVVLIAVCWMSTFFLIDVESYHIQQSLTWSLGPNGARKSDMLFISLILLKLAVAYIQQRKLGLLDFPSNVGSMPYAKSQLLDVGPPFENLSGSFFGRLTFPHFHRFR
jgi:hypothetical protein